VTMAKSGLQMALELVQMRQFEYEKLRDNAVLQRNYGSAAGFEGISVGLMMAAKTIQGEIDQEEKN
jgi:hypothetical protein